MSDLTYLLLLGFGGFFFIVILLLLAVKSFYIKVEQGQALIVNTLSSVPKVTFTGSIVWPVIYKKEVMKISVITLEIDRSGKDGLICKDNLRADINVAFYLRVNETAEDVLKVAKAVGVERASSKEAVNELFNAKFSEALKTVGKKMEFLELFENRIQFRDRIIEVIGEDLNGYVLEDVAIDYLEQTPKSALDPNNILDAEGIRKITQITAVQSVETNRLERDQELEITRKNVSTREAMLELEKQQADAEARQKREIESIQAREQAETQKVVERRKAEQARIETEEALAIAEENKQRQVEIAGKNRERAVAIEHEKVEKARQLEVVNREREVELQTIEKEKALEEERKIIANTISERIAVEKKVAEEEERIKDVRTVSEAERQKQVKVLDAEADAQEVLVKQVKKAEAEERMALHKAKEINTIAQAELEAAAKQAEAQIKRAEGTQAEQAASGLAQARVQEARALAYEKEGEAKARVTAAQAEADQKQGLAEAKVLEEKLSAKARGDEQMGLAEARALKEKLAAQASGDEAIGKAAALAEREKGIAAADVIREKGRAEADGLTEKFSAMDKMSPDAREFEELRMRLDLAFQEVMSTIDANKDIAREQATVLSAALQKAKIEIVGGEGDYFNSFAKALSVGNAVNGMAAKSPMIQQALNRLINLGGNGETVDAESKDEKKA